MNVIDRYLLAVRAFLPRSAQRDIITELSEDLRSRVEDREAGLGRPLTSAEEESLVRDLGHPALLAGRYGPRRQLIGPEVFPFYWLVLRLALCVGIAVHVAVTLAMLAGGKTDQALRQAIVILPLVAFVQFGVITLVFAAIDAYGVLTRFNRHWSPHTLPSIGGRAQPMFHLAFSVLFAAWWLVGLRNPYLVFGAGAAVVKLAPIWTSLSVPILLLVLGDIAWQVVGLTRPQWTRLRTLTRVALGAFQLGVLYALARAGEWVVVADTSRPIESVGHLVTAINQWFPLGFAFAAITLVVAMLVQVRMLGSVRNGAARAH
jgi:hypothetical protein